MNLNIRKWQKLQLAAGAILFIIAWLLGNVLLGIMALICIGFAVFELLSPTPEQRVHSQIAALQQQGVYPPQGQATDDDVQRVLQAGHKLLAIRLYRELHNASLKQAIEAVKQLA